MYLIANSLPIEQIIGISRDLVPKKTARGCPQGSYAYGDTCCCENGCCWDTCSTADPNIYSDCLTGTGAIWARDSVAGNWKAQIGKFKIHSN